MDNSGKGLGWPRSVEDPFLGSLVLSDRRSNVAKEIKIQDTSILILEGFNARIIHLHTLPM